MNLEIVDVSSCKKNLIAEVPVEQMEEEIGQLARKYTREIKVPGFRPGKVPLGIIRQRYASELRSEVTQEIISRTWKQAIAERGLEPIAEPTIEKVEAEPGSPLKFVVSFEILPKIEVTDYKGVTITITAPVIQDSDVEGALENLRQEHAQYSPVENGEVLDGHYVTIALDGEFEGGGKPFHEEDATLIVGAQRTNRTFTENLLGARVDDTRSFDVTYPAEYRQKRLAGKCVHYHVKVKEIKEKQLAELTDEFAGEVGAANLEELRARTRDELVTKARQSAEEKARESALDQIVQRLAFDVPESMVKEELEGHARGIAADLVQQGIDVSKTSIDWKKVFDEQKPFAEQSVRRRMVLDAVARQEKLEVTDAELDGEFQQMAQRSGKSAAVLRAQFEKDQRLQGFRMFLLQNKALDFIFRNATISEG